jgi:LPXTG-motif cell wall-anchored protein
MLRPDRPNWLASLLAVLRRRKIVWLAPLLGVLLSLVAIQAIAAPGGGLVGRISGIVAKGSDNGNNGTIKIDGREFDDHPDDEPHVGCDFQVDFYGFDKGDDLFATVTFALQPPSGQDELLTDEVFIGKDDSSGGGSEEGLDASETYTLDLSGIEPEPNQGVHVKLTIHTGGSKGKGDTKHKVFWVKGCPPGTTTTSSTTSTTLDSTTTSSTVGETTTTVEQPTTTVEQPTTTVEQPTTTVEQPTTTVEQPTTTVEQPTTTVEDTTTTTVPGDTTTTLPEQTTTTIIVVSPSGLPLTGAGTMIPLLLGGLALLAGGTWAVLVARRRRAEPSS